MSENILTRTIKIIDENWYEKGLILACYDEEKLQAKADAKVGDTLALFIVRELVDVYDEQADDTTNLGVFNEKLQSACADLSEAFGRIGDLAEAGEAEAAAAELEGPLLLQARYWCPHEYWGQDFRVLGPNEEPTWFGVPKMQPATEFENMGSDTYPTGTTPKQALQLLSGKDQIYAGKSSQWQNWLKKDVYNPLPAYNVVEYRMYRVADFEDDQKNANAS